MTGIRITMRHEVRETERRAPIVPADDIGAPVEVISIDNLPSLLPGEAGAAFSAELTPHLMTLEEPGAPWQRCLRAYHEACESYGLREGVHV
jgi:saccharopine dehydrogenase (NAD+, L-lysine forming)